MNNTLRKIVSILLIIFSIFVFSYVIIGDWYFIGAEAIIFFLLIISFGMFFLGLNFLIAIPWLKKLFLYVLLLFASVGLLWTWYIWADSANPSSAWIVYIIPSIILLSFLIYSSRKLMKIVGSKLFFLQIGFFVSLLVILGYIFLLIQFLQPQSVLDSVVHDCNSNEYPYCKETRYPQYCFREDLGNSNGRWFYTKEECLSYANKSYGIGSGISQNSGLFTIYTIIFVVFVSLFIFCLRKLMHQKSEVQIDRNDFAP